MPARLKRFPTALVLSTLLGGGAVGCQYLPHHNAKAAAPPAASGPARVLKLDSTTLNLADGISGTGATYLRLGVSLGVDSAANPETDARVQSVARDAIVTLASADTADSLLTPQGKAKLKQDILRDVQRRVPQADVRTVYFDDFLIQR